MSVVVTNVGGTLTGGSSATLTPAGVTPAGRLSLVSSDHSRLAPRQFELGVQPAVTTATDPGVARASVKITFGNRETEDGCCTVKQGSVIVDIGVRWSLNQPDTLVDDVLDYLGPLVMQQFFADMIKKGILPS